MKKWLKERLGKENEGFSLVELIIVIAIMAILMSLIAISAIYLIEKSRVSKDQQTVDTVYSAFNTAASTTEGLSESGTITLVSGAAAPIAGSTEDKLLKETETILGMKLADAAAKLGSKGHSTITCTYNVDTNTVSVVADGTKVPIKSQNK